MKSLEIRIGSASRLLAIAFCATTGVLTASTVTFSDGTFNPANYTTGFLFIGTPGTTATYAQCASCGNTWKNQPTLAEIVSNSPRMPTAIFVTMPAIISEIPSASTRGHAVGRGS